MKIKYLAHSAFLLTSDSGITILTDPYESGGYEGKIQYSPINEAVDIITISHSHADHSYIAPHHQSTTILRQPTAFNFRDIEIVGFETFHDDQCGTQRGDNIVFTFKIENMVCCHLGDLGHTLDEKTLQRIGRVDVLFLPVGGIYTIGRENMDTVMESLSPRICIPMHYKTEKVSFDLLPVEAFIQEKASVIFSNVSQIDLSPARLPSTKKIFVLTPEKL